MSVDVSKKLADIFRAVLDIPETEPVALIAQESCKKWDSVAHMMLITGVESEFGLEIDPDSSIAITSFVAFEQYLQRVVSGGD